MYFYFCRYLCLYVPLLPKLTHMYFHLYVSSSLYIFIYTYSFIFMYLSLNILSLICMYILKNSLCKWYLELMNMMEESVFGDAFEGFVEIHKKAAIKSALPCLSPLIKRREAQRYGLWQRMFISKTTCIYTNVYRDNQICMTQICIDSNIHIYK